MTDEMSEHFRISITFWMMGAFISAVITVAVFSFITYRNYTGKYTDAMIAASNGTIYELAKQSEVACPTAYKAVNASIGEITSVTFKPSGGSEVVVYDFSDGTDDLISLMTGKNSIKNVRVTITPVGNGSGMIKVLLTEVVR